MAITTSETAPSFDQGLTLRPPVTGTTAVTVNVPPAPSARVPMWYEASGVTAAATMLGVLLTVGFGVWNTSKQLKNANEEAEKNRKHESDEAQIDRLRNARRELYSELVDAFITVQGAFGRLAEADPTDPTFGQELRAMGASVNKTWLLSEEDTAVKARELYTVMNEQWLALLPKLAMISNHKASLANFDKQLTELSDSMIQVRSSSGISKLAPKPQYESYKLLKEKAEAEHTALATARINITSEVLNNQNVIMSLVNDVMLSARRELGIINAAGTDLGTDKLAQQSSEMSERMQAALEQLRRSFATFS